MSRTGAKSVAMTVAAGVLTFGVNQLTAGDYYTGVAGMTIGLAVFFGYQYAEERDHQEPANRIIAAIGEQTFERIAEMGADELEDMMDREEGSG